MDGDECHQLSGMSTPLCKEIHVGTYIEVFDNELSIQTWGLDAPRFYGRIQEFIGYDEDYVAAVVRVMTYYRCYGVRLDSYWAGQPRSSSPMNMRRLSSFCDGIIAGFLASTS